MRGPDRGRDKIVMRGDGQGHATAEHHPLCSLPHPPAVIMSRLVSSQPPPPPSPYTSFSLLQLLLLLSSTAGGARDVEGNVREQEHFLPVCGIKPSVSLLSPPPSVLLTLCLVSKVFIQPGIVSSLLGEFLSKK